MVRFKQSTRLGSEIYNERYSNKLWPLVSFVVVVVLAWVRVCAFCSLLVSVPGHFKIQPNIRKGNYVILSCLVSSGRTRPY